MQWLMSFLKHIRIGCPNINKKYKFTVDKKNLFCYNTAEDSSFSESPSEIVCHGLRAHSDK